MDLFFTIFAAFFRFQHYVRWLPLGLDNTRLVKRPELIEVIGKSSKNHLNVDPSDSGNKNMSCFKHCFNDGKRSFTGCSNPAYLQVSHSIPATQWMASC